MGLIIPPNLLSTFPEDMDLPFSGGPTDTTIAGNCQNIPKQVFSRLGGRHRHTQEVIFLAGWSICGGSFMPCQSDNVGGRIVRRDKTLILTGLGRR
jgi:hypothetical protein